MDVEYQLLIDGGLSNVLEEQGCSLNNRLWSAKILKTNPEAIIQAHLTYPESGAHCITTSSHQASVQGIMDSGHDQDTAEAYLLRSTQLADLAKVTFYIRFVSIIELLLYLILGL